MSDIFETASRIKLRFSAEAFGGSITCDDLWDLPLQSERRLSLDGIGMEVQRRIQAAGAVTSLVTPTTSVNKEDELRLAILKRVIEVKQAENAEKARRAENAAKRQRIMELIAKKGDEALGAKSIEELQAELASLGA